MTTFDRTAASRLRRTYATADVVEVRRHIRAALAPAAGERLLDLGCGPGHLALELAREVGASGHVVALDPSPSMREVARAEAADSDVGDRVSVRDGDAAALPFGDGSFDGVAVVQVLEHLEDPGTALTEVHRVLRPGGRVVVVDTDWRSCVWESDDRDRTDRVVRSWESRFKHPHLPGRLPRLLRDCGFGDVSVLALPIVNTDTDEDVFSLGMVGALAAFAADPSRLGPEEAEAWKADIRGRAASGDYFFALNRFLFQAGR